GIAFDERMLKWDAGPRPEDGVWAEFWYSGTHQSKGFQKYLQKTEPFPNKLRPLLQACQPCYDTLINRMN
ncbi:MAG: sulfotransferase family protein, partial [Flavobacteriales bacterium]|nr:sulfotransferase family protein [Flavobacteriales bacterium]